MSEPLPPGPYRVQWPGEQGGLFTLWGKQGTPPDFFDGWAIPWIASGVDTCMFALRDLLNRAATPPLPASAEGNDAAPMTEAGRYSDAHLDDLASWHGGWDGTGSHSYNCAGGGGNCESRQLLDAFRRREAQAAAASGVLDVERLARALHAAEVCLNWSPGYGYLDNNHEHRDDHGPAEHTEAQAIAAAYAAEAEGRPSDGR